MSDVRDPLPHDVRDPLPRDARDVVVLRALGLGDLLTGVPALRALRRHVDGGRVTLLTNPALAPLATLAVPGVDVVGVEPFTLGPLPRLAAGVAVNLHGAGPQSSLRLLALRPRRLVAFRHPDVPETASGPRWRAEEHEADRWCRLLADAGVAADPADLLLPRPVPPPAVPDAIVVHPGASTASRQWPAERYAAVARSLRGAGHRVVVTGGPGERGLAAEVCRLAGLPLGADLSGRTDVVGMAALVAAARLVIAPDTGVAHLASAYGTPSVVLFGPTDPALWGPPPRPQHRVLWAGLVGDPHADSPHDGLLRLSADDVLGAADDVLAVPIDRRPARPAPPVPDSWKEVV